LTQNKKEFRVSVAEVFALPACFEVRRVEKRVKPSAWLYRLMECAADLETAP
jgi:hypothetical protein